MRALVFIFHRVPKMIMHERTQKLFTNTLKRLSDLKPLVTLLKSLRYLCEACKDLLIFIFIYRLQYQPLVDDLVHLIVDLLRHRKVK